MHWSKRIVFLFTLLAFLSNMAFALPVSPGLLQPNQTRDQKAQLEKHQDPALSWFATEALEELEEAEYESEPDLKASLTSDQLVFHQVEFTDHQYHLPYIVPTKYRPGAIRNWSWSSISLNIFFQVFRI